MAIKDHHEKHPNLSIKWMCEVLKISRASYYKWLNRKPTKEEIINEELAQIIIEYDERFNHILGYRRMTQWINHFNHTNYSENRIKRLMKLLGIKSVIRQKKNKYKKSTPEIEAENVLKRDFYATAPNEKWATDVTEFKIIGSSQKLYLSAIIDLYDRSIVSYQLSTRNNNKLVFDTFDKAIEANPGAKPVYHSDRGFQYTSKVFQTKLKDNEMIQSMSRVGCCIDNGPTEGFWGIIKSEMYYLNEFHEVKTLKKAIDDYIYFYNNERLQERYNNQTPIEVRTHALNSEEIEQYPIAENKKIIKYYQNLELKKQKSPSA